VIKRIPLTNGSTLLRGICVSPDGRFVAVAHSLARFHLPTTHVTLGWITCHRGPLFTDLKPHAVETGKYDERGDIFYTPTLVEVWRTGPYLHDGSAATLRDAITTHNSKDLRGKTSQLSSGQIDDLVAYVQSL